uniref:Uncharacterized protein n=1 Tax=viral metagenome TaxID=1070528 RepID=A0A6C0EFX6_9ZZZZ
MLSNDASLAEPSLSVILLICDVGVQRPASMSSRLTSDSFEGKFVGEGRLDP